MQNRRLGIIALLVAALFWGPAPVATKVALHEVPELAFLFLGRFIALIVLALFFARPKYLRIDKKDLPKIILAGFAGSVLNVTLFVFGVERTTAMNAQALFSAVPIITTLSAIFILGEKVKSVQVIGVLIGFIGTVLIATRTIFETGVFDGGDALGNILILLAATSWAFYILLSRELSKRYEPATITIYSFLISSIALFPGFAYVTLSNPNWIEGVGIGGYSGLFYIGICASVIAFFAYQTGIKLTSAFAAGVVLYLQPIVTTAVASVVLDEKITLPYIAGSILITLGCVIATQFELIKSSIRKRKR